jgi:hypothetical protein
MCVSAGFSLMVIVLLLLDAKKFFAKNTHRPKSLNSFQFSQAKTPEPRRSFFFAEVYLNFTSPLHKPSPEQPF